MEGSASGDFVWLINGSNDSNTTCTMFKTVLTAGKQPYEILSFLTPLNSQVWTERSVAWTTGYKVYIGILATFFLLLGILATVLIYKKDCIRLQTKTFLAVYSSIAILGFSRTIFLVLDPYGLLGFIADRFGGWIIISRLVAALGFPSLVASYTLVFLTLLKLSKTSMGRQWYQKWKFVAPIAATPYVIALGAEVIGNIAPYPALISVLACESFFTIFGILLCGVFLFAGRRLMHKIRLQERRTVRVTSFMVSNGDRENSHSVQTSNFATEENRRRHRRFQKTTRKITIITYATALLGIIYSMITAANIVVIGLFIFDNCLGFSARGNSAAWLILQIGLRSAEIPLALVMLYSITDVSSLVKYVKLLLRCNCCRKNRQPVLCNRQTTLRDMHLNTQSQSSMGLVESRTMNTSMESVDNIPTDSNVDAVEQNTVGARAFMLNAQGDSESSINAEVINATAEKSTQTIELSDKAVQTDKPSPSKPPHRHHGHSRHVHPNTTSTPSGSKFTRKFTV